MHASPHFGSTEHSAHSFFFFKVLTCNTVFWGPEPWSNLASNFVTNLANHLGYFFKRNLAFIETGSRNCGVKSIYEGTETVRRGYLVVKSVFGRCKNIFICFILLTSLCGETTNKFNLTDLIEMGQMSSCGQFDGAAAMPMSNCRFITKYGQDIYVLGKSSLPIFSLSSEIF